MLAEPIVCSLCRRDDGEATQDRISGVVVVRDVETRDVIALFQAHRVCSRLRASPHQAVTVTGLTDVLKRSDCAYWMCITIAVAAAARQGSHSLVPVYS